MTFDEVLPTLCSAGKAARWGWDSKRIHVTILPYCNCFSILSKSFTDCDGVDELVSYAPWTPTFYDMVHADDWRIVRDF